MNAEETRLPGALGESVAELEELAKETKKSGEGVASETVAVQMMRSARRLAVIAKRLAEEKNKQRSEEPE